MHTQIHTRMHTHKHIHICTQTHTHTHTHTHMNTYMHTHACAVINVTLIMVSYWYVMKCHITDSVDVATSVDDS